MLSYRALSETTTLIRHNLEIVGPIDNVRLSVTKVDDKVALMSTAMNFTLNHPSQDRKVQVIAAGTELVWVILQDGDDVSPMLCTGDSWFEAATEALSTGELEAF